MKDNKALSFAVVCLVVAGARASAGGPCDCVLAGSTHLPFLMGQYANSTMYPHAMYYGTACAAWDMVPGTPFHEYCDPAQTGSNDFSGASNWCQSPWCYVGPDCPTGAPTGVFTDTTLKYSYAQCGGADCYSDPTAAGCPYDPYGTMSYEVHKGGDCACLYHGAELDPSIYQNYPSSSPGAYANEMGVKIYGSTCAAWDMMPGTPWYLYCPAGADWCDLTYNWCQAPWCYVSSACSTGVASSTFSGSPVAFYSYDTCDSALDCFTTDANGTYSAGCPFDDGTNNWWAPMDCDVPAPSPSCECVFQGATHSASLLGAYGDGAAYPFAPYYGTACAAWDMVPGTPFFEYCDPNVTGSSDFSNANNWCQSPWCYVNPDCPTAVATSVFPGTSLTYSYAQCGGQDCYADPAAAGCPFDPYGTMSYEVHKGGDCACLFHGGLLDPSIYTNYPSSSPGAYAGYPGTPIYGSTCAAWDAMPGMPWYSYCPAGSDWCSTGVNWCQIPFCYVSSTCATGVASSTFAGSPAAFFSYDTCMSSLDCFTADANGTYAAGCPYDDSSNEWWAPMDCSSGSPSPSPPISDPDCQCVHAGSTHTPTLLGQYGNATMYPHAPYYGTSCAAWDMVPGTPYFSYCDPAQTGNTDFSSGSNWCQSPWCYVGPNCATAVPTVVFSGTTLKYSYGQCGGVDCYADPNAAGCPFDPYGTMSYEVHKGGDCACLYHGAELDPDIYTNYPTSNPGAYANDMGVKIYGSTCAAWDAMPGTPWYLYCPAGAPWCDLTYNWCQVPWCYVSSACNTGVASATFAGSPVAFYSYDTCMSSVDCYTTDANGQYAAECPFDDATNEWWAPMECDVPAPSPASCECVFQGTTHTPSTLGQYSDASMYPFAEYYGTACAAWDMVPGTPYFSYCDPNQTGSSDFSSTNNWCQSPWCYVNPDCADGVPTEVFAGTSLKYSYSQCGGVDCYADPNAPGCPFDPYGTMSYVVHKGDDCACLFHGGLLDPSIYTNYPSSNPGAYAEYMGTPIYGSTCAAWDSMPGMPWYSYCPAGSDWCDTSVNWCQIPFCYVSATCATGVPSSTFAGSPAAFFSYDTCMSSLDCFTTDANGNYAAGCPYDDSSNGWWAPMDCTTSGPGGPQCLSVTQDQMTNLNLVPCPSA